MLDLSQLPRLSEEELEMVRKAFMLFDKGSGTINVKELKNALTALGQSPTDEELFVMVSQVDEDGSKEIEFQEFVHAIQINKALTDRAGDESETLDAFVALGGSGDKSGAIKVDRLSRIIQDFELSLDVQKATGAELEAGRAEDGVLSYHEFKALLA